MHTKFFATALLLCSILVAGCSPDEPKQAESSATDEITLQLGDRPLTLEGFNGTIEVQGRRDSTASVRIEKSVSALGQARTDSLLDAINVEQSEDGDRYLLRVASEATDATADIYLTMPYKTPLSIETSNGNVEIEAMAAPVEVEVAQGNVQVSGAANDLDIRTRNGTIDVDMAGFPDSTEVRLRTGNGPINLALPAQVPALLRADAQVGTITLTGFELENRQESSSTTGLYVQGVMGEGEGRIRLRSENGSIEVTKQ